MKVTFSPRETGACPLCKKANRCPLKNRFTDSLLHHEAETGTGFEIVIYVCPYFIEEG